MSGLLPSAGTIALGEAAVAAGSRALLLPMPMFFRYQQEDLQAFAAHVSRTLRAPCLLYDLPDFTNGLAPATVLALLRDEEFIVGIKDSSGREENLATFADRAHGSRGGRCSSATTGCCDAGLQRGMGRRHFRRGRMLSRTAGRDRPELPGRPAATKRRRLQALLDELIARLSVFPTPWGIQIALEARGFPTGPLPLPLSPTRLQQIAEFQTWFRAWIVTSFPGIRDQGSERASIK